MAWTIRYHPDVREDFRRLGRTEARIVQRVIDERLAHGEPEKSGKALSGDLAGYWRLRTGQTRTVYRVDGKQIEVLVIAVASGAMMSCMRLPSGGWNRVLRLWW